VTYLYRGDEVANILVTLLDNYFLKLFQICSLMELKLMQAVGRRFWWFSVI